MKIINIPSPEDFSVWLNLVSFMARLVTGCRPDHPLNFAFLDLRDALEKTGSFKEMVSCEVSAASQWIIRCGERLYRYWKGIPRNWVLCNGMRIFQKTVDPCTMASLAFIENAGNFGCGDFARLHVKWMKRPQKWL